LLVRMMTEGARWTGNGAIHFWQGPSVAVGQYDANAPIAVFCREWDWTAGSGERMPRLLRFFNDTHEAEPITFRDELRIGVGRAAGIRRASVVLPHPISGAPFVLAPGANVLSVSGKTLRS